MNGLLTASEVAGTLRIHVNTVYYYLERGRLLGHRIIGNRWRIKQEDLDAFVNDVNERKENRRLNRDTLNQESKTVG